MKTDHLIWPQDGWGYMPPTDEVFDMFRYCRDNCNPKNVLEIGFYAGHSTTYMFEIFDDPKIESYGLSKQHIRQAAKIKDIYKNFEYHIPCHSSGVYAEGMRKDKYDFALIDGGHDYHIAASDILQCIMLGVPYLLIDNTDQYPVQVAIDLFQKTLDLKQVFVYNATHKNIHRLNEARLYYVQPNNIQQLIRQ